MGFGAKVIAPHYHHPVLELSISNSSALTPLTLARCRRVFLILNRDKISTEAYLSQGTSSPCLPQLLGLAKEESVIQQSGTRMVQHILGMKQAAES